jgi:polysaccharide export outer membrane protein
LIIFLGVVGWLQTASAQDSTPPTPVQNDVHNNLPNDVLNDVQNNVSNPGRTTQPAIVAVPSENQNSEHQNSEQKTLGPAIPSGLVIGPGDEVEITVYGAPDLSGHMRVSATGNISIPLVGYIRVAGLSSSEAEASIEAKLREKSVVNEPQVSVYVKEYGSSGISVAGEVAKPGFYSALGPHRLLDVMQAAGGPTERASNKVIISHRGQQDVTTITLSKNASEMAADNIDLQPGDTVIVPKAGIVYVLGEVTKPGGYVMNATGGVTVLQIVAVAGGPTHVAKSGKTRLLRKTDTGFQEQQIDLTKLLRGKVQDVSVRDEDIVYVPSSAIKTALNASALVAVAASTAIYRVPF